MSNFRLIAVIPLKGCDTNYSKNLERGKPYLFCKNYTVEFDESGIITGVTKTGPDIPDSIFELHNGIKLSFSALVGKNGSGKSSIIDLLLYFIYAVYTQKHYKGEKILFTEEEEIQKRVVTIQRDYKSLDDIIKNIDKASADKAKDYNANLWKALELMRVHRIHLTQEEQKDPETLVKKVRAQLLDSVLVRQLAKQRDQHVEDTLLLQNLAVAILFEKDGLINEVNYRKGEFSFNRYIPQRIPVTASIEEFGLEEFFYTICVNYSHHSLNSRAVGGWINKLFHKNDGYVTPVVINPMRDEGNFNINDELKLSKERLFANILYDMAQGNTTKILGKYEIVTFNFTPKVLTSRFKKPLTDRVFNKLLSKPLLLAYGITSLSDAGDYWDLALDYLESKIERIGERYVFAYYNPNLKQSKQKQLIGFLLKDKTHITKKVRQVLNFLEGTVGKPSGRQYWAITPPPPTLVKSMSPENMKLWLESFGLDITAMTPPQLIEYGLPGLFNFDLILKPPLGKEIPFSRLSSGEQQLVFNSNSILYHLYNLDSVHSVAQSEADILGSGRVRYKNVNVVLDEVELYYHPEMQRKLVSELIANFERVKKYGEPGIEAINVTILTHSPFILSDIPDQHVLSLTTDKNEPEFFPGGTKTFGGNIHEILINNFFMDSTIGEHSIKTIEQLIRLYTDAQQADTPDKRKKLTENYQGLKEKYEFVLQTVGEDVIKEVLSNNLAYIEFVISLENEKN
jgi:predicted ATP-binding protein involved in virulence